MGISKYDNLLVQITTRELHNDLMKTLSDGGILKSRSESGDVIISETILRQLKPSQVKIMSNFHIVMCRCELFISVYIM